MSAISIAPLSSQSTLAEGPHWIEAEKSLIYTDIKKKTINKYFYESRRHQVVDLDITLNDAGPSVVIPVDGVPDRYIFGAGHSLSSFSWKASDPDEGRMESVVLTHFDRDKPNNYVTEAKCDSLGRLWAGTGTNLWPKHKSTRGGFFKVTSALVNQKVFDVHHFSGLTWSPSYNLLYYIDSKKYSVYVLDFFPADGKLVNKRRLIKLKSEKRRQECPDGMTVDQNGSLWITLFSGGKVICVDTKTSRVIRKVKLPAPNISSCCFGGPDYSSLFVTTGTFGMTDDELKLYPESGNIFEIKGLGVKGCPANSFKMEQYVT